MARGQWDVDCAVIGGGPGGLVSALYLRRFKRPVALINAGKPRAAWIPRTHNLIGFPNGISGQVLLRRLNAHVDALGALRLRGEARVDRVSGGFGVRYAGQSLKARTVILATGVEDLQPDIPNLIDLRKRGLLRYCPVCDAYDHCDRKLAVIAGDNSGIVKGLFLTSFTRKLHIVVPEDLKVAAQTRACLKRHGVKLHASRLIAMEPQGRGKGLRLELASGRGFQADACYVELGCKVRDQAFAHLKGLRRTNDGFITTTTECRTGVPGLFAVGDCVNLLAQLGVAAGQAAVAATTIHNDLLEY